MRDINYPQLDEFIHAINPVEQTTRRASEDFHNCPALSLVTKGQLQVRTLIDATLSDFNKLENDMGEVEKRGSAFLEQVKEDYWKPIARVKDEVVFWGAASFNDVESYLHVHKQRHEGEIRRAVREKYPTDNPGIQLLNSVETYAEQLELDIPTAARVATTHVKYQLPAMKRRVLELQQQGMVPEQASKEAFREFSMTTVPSHIEAVKTRDLKNISAQINKPSFYDTPHLEEDLPALRLSLEDAKGLMSVYPLEKMPYDEQELALAEKIIQDPALKASLLLFQMKVVDYAKDYLRQNPERMQNKERLYPFTEFFVVEKDNDDPSTALVQNPKLLQVISNNYVPAIASVLRRDNTSLNEMTMEQLVESAEEAKRRRVFQLQIGKFNNYDARTNTVELDAIFDRVCPAMQMLTTGLKTWMPRIYAHSRNQMR